jgi:methylenetetrahydrofolate dehydrogenase (NADP+)/methenyltetrahydrofolate cyclohydrolase
MSAQIINGRSLAAGILEQARLAVARLPEAPGLAAVLVGDDPASHIYVGLKEKACHEAGINFIKVVLRADVGQARLLEVIADLDARPGIHAILLQLPLPVGYDYDVNEAVAAIDPKKDVDGFHPDNLALLRQGKPRIVPGLASGIVELIKKTEATLTGLSALVVANSEVFFEPLALALEQIGVSAAFRFAKDEDLAKATCQADIVIVAAGRPKLITGGMIKPGAIIIDAGTNRTAQGVVGDVDRQSVASLAGFITPVPGGVGPMTVAMVVKNCIELARAQME